MYTLAIGKGNLKIQRPGLIICASRASNEGSRLQFVFTVHSSHNSCPRHDQYPTVCCCSMLQACWVMYKNIQ